MVNVLRQAGLCGRRLLLIIRACLRLLLPNYLHTALYYFCALSIVVSQPIRTVGFIFECCNTVARYRSEFFLTE